MTDNRDRRKRVRYCAPNPVLVISGPCALVCERRTPCVSTVFFFLPPPNPIKFEPWFVTDSFALFSCSVLQGQIKPVLEKLKSDPDADVQFYATEAYDGKGLIRRCVSRQPQSANRQ